MSIPFRHEGREHNERARQSLLADVLSSLRGRVHAPGGDGDGMAPPSAPEPEPARLEDLIAAAVAELSRRHPPTPPRGQHSLGAGVLASLMARHRPGVRLDR